MSLCAKVIGRPLTKRERSRAFVLALSHPDIEWDASAINHNEAIDKYEKEPEDDWYRQ